MELEPIQDLVQEHRYILKVVQALKAIGDELQGGALFDEKLFRNIIAFMREYADKCHHAKEEDLLFPALIEEGVPETGCPIGGLKGEHVKGRKLVGLLEEGVDLYSNKPEEALAVLKQAIDGITSLYPDHIWKEDQMVFPMAERLLSEGRLAGLGQAFSQVDSASAESLYRHQEFATELAEKYHVTSEK